MVAILLFTIFTCIYVEIMNKYKRIALVISGMIPFTFVMAEPHWDWFGQWKTWSIAIPVFFFTYTALHTQMNTFTRQSKFITLTKILSFFMFFNLLLVVPKEFESPYWYSHINAVYTLILALLTPIEWRISNDRNTLGYRSPYWIALYCSTNCFLFLNNPLLESVRTTGTMIVIISILACVKYRDSLVWISYRAYSLHFLITLRANFPPLVFLPNIFPRFSTSFISLWLLINLCLIFLTIKENTFFMIKTPTSQPTY